MTKKKTSAKTKDQLVEENSHLREEIMSLTDKLKKAVGFQSADIGDNPGIAVGLYKKDGEYHMVKIAFNAENQAAKVIEDGLASRIPGAAHMAQLSVTKYFVDEVFPQLERQDA